MTDTTTGTTHPTPDRGSYVEHERGPAVRFERHYPFPVERVWRAVTDPAELRAWFPSPEVTFEARVGGTITLAGDPYQAEAMTGRVLAWDPPHVFGFEWGGDQLFLTVTADGEGSRLELLDVLDEKTRAALHAAGWTMCLAGLDRALTGASDAAPEFRPLLEEYRAAGFPDDGWVPDGV